MSGEGTTPQVGETVIWDGDPHQITTVTDRTLDFTDGATMRTVALHDLAPIPDAPGTWGVIGRTTKRPPSQRLGVQYAPAAAPATEEG